MFYALKSKAMVTVNNVVDKVKNSKHAGTGIIVTVALILLALALIVALNPELVNYVKTMMSGITTKSTAILNGN